MKFLDFFKKKHFFVPAGLWKGKKKPEKEKAVPKEAVKEKPKPPAAKPVRPKKKQTGVAPLVLASPHITEKATGLTNRGQYIFKVFPRANKQLVKEAVEQVYGVDVINVRTITVPRKQKRLGRTRGWRQGYKKAIVTLKQGQEIEIMPR